MQDSTLLKYATITALMGIIALFFLSQNLKTEDLPLNQIQNTADDKMVTIHGFIESVKKYNESTRLTINSSCSVKAVIFEPIDLAPGQRIIAKGKISSQNDEKEIIIDSIKQK
jgi:hypothetical protein